MNARRMLLGITLIGALVLAVACSQGGDNGGVTGTSTSSMEEIVIENQTKYPVEVSIDGVREGTVRPGEIAGFAGHYTGRRTVQAAFYTFPAPTPTLTKQFDVPAGGTVTWTIPANTIGGPGSASDLS